MERHVELATNNTMKKEIVICKISKTFAEKRKEKILEIFSRGKTAVFTNVINGVRKTATKWILDEEMGDLVADTSTGRVKFIAWDSDQYELTEE